MFALFPFCLSEPRKIMRCSLARTCLYTRLGKKGAVAVAGGGRTILLMRAWFLIKKKIYNIVWKGNLDCLVSVIHYSKRFDIR